MHAALIPFETEKVQDPAGPSLLVGDQFFVRHVQNGSRRKYGTPVRNKKLMLPVVVRQVRQVLGEVQGWRELLEITRQARVDWVTSHVDDASLREYRVDHTQIVGVDWCLIHDAQCLDGMARQSPQIFLRQLFP